MFCNNRNCCKERKIYFRKVFQIKIKVWLTFLILCCRSNPSNREYFSFDFFDDFSDSFDFDFVFADIYVDCSRFLGISSRSFLTGDLLLFTLIGTVTTASFVRPILGSFSYLAKIRFFSIGLGGLSSSNSMLSSFLFKSNAIDDIFSVSSNKWLWRRFIRILNTPGR